MEDDFAAWDCSWYWDNGFGDLASFVMLYQDLLNVIDTSTSYRNERSVVGTNGLLMADSAFCDLETESVNDKDAHLDQFRLAYSDEQVQFRHCCIATLSQVSLSSDDNESMSSISEGSFPPEESYCTNDGVASVSIELRETSDIGSVRHHASSNLQAVSVSHCVSDTLPVLSNQRQFESSSDENKPSVGSLSANLSVDICSDAVRNELQAVQHRPLIFFVIGLFVGLSLGFFTCIVTLSAAIHRMHLEIVNGRSLYSQCQHQCKHIQQSVCAEVSKVSIDEVIGSIWREKFEEMVIENADLQAKLSLLEDEMSASLDKMQNDVSKLNWELTALKDTVDNSASSLADHCPMTTANASAENGAILDRDGCGRRLRYQDYCQCD